MKFYVLTLFPEMITDALSNSIVGRAMERGQIALEAVNIRDYTLDKHKKVDDYPYGGGAGMVMQAQPIYDAYQHICEEVGHKVRCIYLTPQGRTFTQQIAHEYAVTEDVCLLCGHYEGIDERVLEEIVDDYISIGDYVLTGGELGAMVLIDAISRLVPGVLHNDDSASTESFEQGLLEYPQYSRPETWNGKSVPPILLSGDHAKVDLWRHEMSLKRTLERRPDLLDSYELTEADRKYLKELDNDEKSC
ncbi:tRNA (guanine37-N1)-methyltransferase [Lachnospiraceae bacterium A10]|nr:tRNA (guanine37-N1)-methyltransferase [Lachnospiraceae bacterium A10]